MNDKNLVLAMSINERRKILKKISEKESENLINKWLEHKSLMTPELFEVKLLIEGMSSEEFSLGIKEITEEDADVLYQHLPHHEWYTIHREVLNNKSVYKKEVILDEFYFFTYPYCQWAEKKIRNSSLIQGLNVSEEVISEAVLSVHKEILSISLKTLVYDQNEYQNRTDETYSEETCLEKYLKERFNGTSGYIEFFNDYPVLARLLATRVNFFVKNFDFFLNSLVNAKNKLSKIFSIKNMALKEISFSNGDSHNQGKTVIIFMLDNKKLVYKFKNLCICEKLDCFYDYLESLDSRLSFLRIKRVVDESYTIEEYMDYQECQSMESVNRYYYRFGQMIMILHLLGGNDFHLENIIAIDDYPVPIDLETIIQNERGVKNLGSAETTYADFLNDSIIGTSLLPNIYASSSGTKNVELSALSGGEQLLPFKVLQLEKKETGKMKMVYADYKMEGSNNLPRFQGKEMNYLDYSEEILKGYSDAYQIILQNKNNLSKKIKQLFSGEVVRNVLKSTQKYADMLEYAYHPSYMTNYIRREKLMENLWAYPYNNKEVIAFEIQDMLNNDVPAFFNSTNARDLINGENIIENYYEFDSLFHSVKRISGYSEADYNVQKNILLVALQKYHGEICSYKIHNSSVKDPVEKAVCIADYICEKAIMGTKYMDITWTSLTVDVEGQWFIKSMSKSYYDGLSGIYILLISLQKVLGDNRYYEHICRLEKVLFSGIKQIDNMEQYVDAISILYALCLKLSNIANAKNRLLAKKTFDSIKVFYQSQKSFSDEWLFGRASLIKICLNYYSVSNNGEALEFAVNVSNGITLKEMNDFGFAHGYAGILYSLLCLAEMKGVTSALDAKITWYIEKIVQIDMELEENISWCNGLGGFCIALSRYNQLRNNTDYRANKLLKTVVKNITNGKTKSDCLCHGNLGTLELMEKIINTDGIDEEYKKNSIQLRNKIMNKNGQYLIQGLDSIPCHGLMTGLAGVSYGYLKHAVPALPSILFLEI